MRVLYVLGSTMMAGSTISFKVIVDGMLSKGCEPIVLVSRNNVNKDFVDYLISQKCIVEFFEAEMAIYPQHSMEEGYGHIAKFPFRLTRKLFKLYKSNREIKLLIKKHNPDIVHTNVGVFYYVAEYCIKKNIPHLLHLREYQTKDFGWHIMPSKHRFKKIAAATNVVAITEDILRYFNLEYSKNAKAIWDGILPQNDTVYKHHKQPFFLCANRISPEKNIEDVIKGFANVADQLSNYKLLIVGKIHNKLYYEKLQMIVRELKCKDRIEFQDHRHDVVNLMEDATALIVASRFEGLGRMTIEATFKGCLVIGRNKGGTKEIISTTKGGYLFNDAVQMGRQMLLTASIANTEQYEKKIQQASKIAVERCTNENYCNTIFALYKNILSNQQPAL
ncbi:MAG: glycosyltransferase [Sphingobacteriia bacterium]|nr:glycosyltransferase [Sphingobacteriia bacterium]